MELCSFTLMYAVVLCLAVIIARFLFVIYHTGRSLRSRRDLQPLRTLIVLGSGGHTAEMLNLLAVLDKDKFKPRFYVSAVTDSMSLQKAKAYEESIVICNGPGTCIPVCACSFLFKVMGVQWSTIFYVESIARVRRLSLSGLLLYHLRMVDQLFVQWPYLKSAYPRAHYVGRLM